MAINYAHKYLSNFDTIEFSKDGDFEEFDGYKYYHTRMYPIISEEEMAELGGGNLGGPWYWVRAMA